MKYKRTEWDKRLPLAVDVEQRLRRAGTPHDIPEKAEPAYSWICFGCGASGQKKFQLPGEARRGMAKHWMDVVRKWHEKKRQKNPYSFGPRPTCQLEKQGLVVLCQPGEQPIDAAERMMKSLEDLEQIDTEDPDDDDVKDA